MDNSELSVDSIIKKYEQRQEVLSQSVANNKINQINTVP